MAATQQPMHTYEWATLAKNRRAEKRYLRPLQDLCIDKIVAYLPMFVKVQREEPFKCLPPAVMTRLIESLLSVPFELDREPGFDLDKQPCCLHKLFIGWNTQKVRVDMAEWEPGDFYEFCQLLRKAERSLMNLHIQTMRIAKFDFHRTLPHLRKLQVLVILTRNSPVVSVVDDDTMKVIGTNLPLLRKLMFGCNSVTEQGIKYLCQDDSPHGKCKNLEHIDLAPRIHEQIMHTSNDKCCKLSAHGILYALENLPNLIRFFHPNTFEAVVLYHQKYGPSRKLKFKGVIGSVNEEVTSFEQNNENVAMFLATAPDVQGVYINDESTIDLSLLLRASTISLINLRNDKVDNEIIKKLCQHLGSTVKNMNLRTDTNIDVSVIGHYCPNLKSLTWDCPSTNRHEFDMEGKFTKLVSFSIFDVSNSFPLKAVTSMLTSECLKAVYGLNGVNCLTEETLGRIVFNAISNKKIFSCLTDFNIYSNSVTLETLEYIVYVAPNINRVFNGFKDADRLQLLVTVINSSPHEVYYSCIRNMTQLELIRDKYEQVGPTPVLSPPIEALCTSVK